MAANDAQSVDQVALENIGRSQAGRIVRQNQGVPFEGRQRLQRVDRPQGRIEMSVSNLQPLHKILGVGQMAGTELGICGAGPHELPKLLLAHRPHGGDVEWFARVNELVSQGDDFFPERQVPRDRASLTRACRS